MPAPGVPNNANGVNGFQGFGNEAPYGEATKVAALTRAAPVAGAPLAAGAISAPKRATRRAVGGGAMPVPVAPAAPLTPAPSATLALQWQQIASIPGASDLVKEYATVAARNPVG